MMHQIILMAFFRNITLLILLSICSCKTDKKENTVLHNQKTETIIINYAKGFTIEKQVTGVTIIKITSPWPNAEASFTYALVPKKIQATVSLNKDDYDAIVTTPVERIIVTSTTHIPALEALGAENRLIGFPNTNFISSPKTRKLINNGKVTELGVNESLNTEMVIAANPDLVIGFGIDNQNKTYNTLQRSGIPVVYNGDWTEETPLGKAEWIKFFAPFFQAEEKATDVFNDIVTSYNNTKLLAKKAQQQPTVITGGLFKDVWHVAGGKSWMAQFLIDAHTNYLWADTKETGGIGLSVESVFDTGGKAEFWISPSNSKSYVELGTKNQHYKQFEAFKNKKIYTNTLSKGETDGLIFFELAPNRPDLVLKDLIHIFHPELMPDHSLMFFKPLQ